MNEHLTQAEVAREAQVTEVTIRNRYKELAQKVNFTINIKKKTS
jgi:transcription initiation factor TFIIIB Brf1 subunit/transcription initiation factor TFIIB